MADIPSKARKQPIIMGSRKVRLTIPQATTGTCLPYGIDASDYIDCISVDLINGFLPQASVGRKKPSTGLVC